MITRRRFLQLGSMAGAGLLLPWELTLGCGNAGSTADTVAPQFRLPAVIDRFNDPLPVPPVLTPDTEAFTGSDYYEIGISQFQQQLHSQLPASTVWGYGGNTPGPTIEARAGRPVRIKWINDALPKTHPLRDAIDSSIDHGMQYPEVRTVTHLHGGHTPPQSDGQPEAWASPGGATVGPDYSAGDYVYPNSQQAATLWYHDHAMGITRLNVYMGLAGFYIIRDETEDKLDLPRGDYEIPIMIQDRMINADGSLHYPLRGNTAVHPVWNPHFFGDIAIVNGKAFPYLEVEPRRYRLRLLNASQARYYNLRLETAAGKQIPFNIIGSDGGLLAKPAEMNRLLIAPAERYDLMVDFSGMETANITLRNDAAAPLPEGGGPSLSEIMQFRVSKPLNGATDSSPPARLVLPPIAALAATPGIPAREIVLYENQVPASETVDPDLGGEPRTGMTSLLINARYFADPVEEQPKAGTTEIWEVYNATLMNHPIHLHLVQFQVLNRQALDGNSFFNPWYAWRTGSSPRPSFADFLTGPPVPPRPEESGWKDTVQSGPLEIVRLIAKFDLPSGAKAPARYVYHCHILEHEDNEMMRPYDVV